MRRAAIITGVLCLLGGGALSAVALASGAEVGVVDLTFVHKPTLMTAAYKVYGNPEAVGGKYWLAKLTLRNSGAGSLRDVRVSWQVPGQVGWTTPDVYPEVLPGQTIVAPFYPKLPPTVSSITSMTPSTVELKVDYHDGAEAKSVTQRRDFQLRGVHEIEYSSLPSSEILTFYDLHDNLELSSAWVTEEDPAVRTFYTKVSELAGGFGTMGNFKEIEQLARSTYNTMLALGMTYSGTKGLPEKRGDETVLVQSMRLPRDIIYGNSGLCIELAQLWCSIAMNAGARCYLMLIPGHAFPVIAALDGSVLPIEATGIGGSFQGGNLGGAASFEDAVKSAHANFMKARSGEMPHMLMDVAAFRNQGVRPPELADIDRPALIAMLDQRLKDRQGTGGGPGSPAAGVGGGGPPVGPGGGGGGGGGAAQGTGWADPNGRVALAYPAGWAPNPGLVQQMRAAFPGYAFSAMNPQTQMQVDVIFFDGASDVQQVAGIMTTTFRKLGFKVELGQPQQGQLGGRASVSTSYVTQGHGLDVGGMVTAVQVPTGMVVLTFGGPRANLQAGMGELEQVVNTVQFGR